MRNIRDIRPVCFISAILSIYICLVSTAQAIPLPGTIRTLVGGGNGDGGPATSALLSPVAVAGDSLGNIYVAEQSRRLIRKITPGGGISTLAGNGIGGVGGDGSPATAASLARVTALAVSGTALYLSQQLPGGALVRQIDLASGIISALAGGVTNSAYLDSTPATSVLLGSASGLAATGTLVFISDGMFVRSVDTSTGMISTLAGGGTTYGDGGPATAASLSQTASLAVLPGQLLIADAGNNNVRAVDLATGLISTVAGSATGLPGFTGDNGPATSALLQFVDGLAATGNAIYISDGILGVIRKVDTTSGLISTFAGLTYAAGIGDGGPASAAVFLTPTDLWASPGSLLICDQGHHEIRAIDFSSSLITCTAGSGFSAFTGSQEPALSAAINAPSDVAEDNQGNLFYTAVNTIWRFDKASGLVSLHAGRPGQIASSGDQGPATSAVLGSPSALAMDSAGNLYVADWGFGAVAVLSATTQVFSLVAGQGSIPGTTTYGGDGGPATAAWLNEPSGLLLDGNGLLFITDSWNNAVFQVDLNTGIINTVAGSPGQARGYDGDNGPATSALLNYPFGNPALDSSGNLYIADSGNNVIRQVNLSSGNIKTFAGTGAAGYSGDHAAALLANLSSPRYLRYDPKGDLYFSDSGNKVVRVIHLATGVISTVAGAPSASAVGDNGPALAASLDPLGLLVNSGGDLLVADYQGRIREIFSPQPDLYGNPVIAPLAQQMNHPILAPVPLKAGEPLCSYFDAGPKSSTWDVYNTVGTHVSTARFGTEPDQCLQTSGLITGVYMVRIQVQYVDDTVKSTWQKIVITK